MKISTHRLSIATAAILAYPVALHAQDHDPPSENPASEGEYTREHQIVFFGVLEGLYTDGVNSEDLELIVPDRESIVIEDAPEKMNFVFGCPICAPAFDACRLYFHRPKISLQKKTEHRTFGVGLDEDIRERLRGAPDVRRETIKWLVQRWIERRLDTLDLTEDERAEIEQNLAEMRKEGERMLASHKRRDDRWSKTYAGWEECPFCSGAAPDGQ